MRGAVYVCPACAAGDCRACQAPLSATADEVPGPRCSCRHNGAEAEAFRLLAWLRPYVTGKHPGGYTLTRGLVDEITARFERLEHELAGVEIDGPESERAVRLLSAALVEDTDRLVDLALRDPDPRAALLAFATVTASTLQALGNLLPNFAELVVGQLGVDLEGAPA